MQQLPDIEKTDSRAESFCLNMKKNIGRRKVGENFKTDTDKLIFVMCRYRNSSHLNDSEVDLMLTEY